MRELIIMPRMFGGMFGGMTGGLYYPGGFPQSWQTNNWRGNAKEQLEVAVKNYYNFHTGDDPVATKEQTELLIEFLIYYINAPIWLLNPFDATPIVLLIRKADKMRTIQDIDEFIQDCMDIGMDPL